MQTGKKNDRDTEGALHKLFKDAYSPFLLLKPVRVMVVVLFLGWLCSSIAVAPKIEIGLDQELSMPEDSYMLNYFSVNLIPPPQSTFHPIDTNCNPV